MATELTTELQKHCFSSRLPDMEFETDCEKLTVALCDPNISNVDSPFGEILKVTLTPAGGEVTLWEVRDVVEKYMRLHGYDNMKLCVRWKEPEDAGYTTSPTTMRVYYCKEIGPDFIISDDEKGLDLWGDHYFLSTAQSKVLPPEGATERLYFWAQNSDERRKAWVTYRLEDGTVRGMDVNIDNIYGSGLRLYFVSFTVAALRTQVETELETSVEVIAVTVRVGQRSMVYYKPELPATAAFAFMNVFGVTEVAWLHCATTTKRKDGRKIANVARRAAVYDMDLEVTHEVETAPLPLATAQWLAQLVTSPKVWLADGTPVIITDGTSEVNDDHSVMNTVKFTWKRDDNRGTLGESAEDIQIFTQPPFSFQFD